MQVLLHGSFITLVFLTMVLIGLKLRIDRHQSGLRAAFEANRILARARIDNLHTWMGVVGIVFMIALVTFIVTAIMDYQANPIPRC